MKNRKFKLATAVCGLLIFSIVCTMAGKQRLDQRAIASSPVVEVTLEKFMTDGPPENRHVRLTDFVFGEGYLIAKKNKFWTGVWIPLFPRSSHGGRKEIKVIAETHNVRNEAQLHQFVQQGELVGIRSATPMSSGVTVADRLRNVNPGVELTSAWVIKEVRDVPGLGGIYVAAGCGVASFVGAIMALAALIRKPKGDNR